ncbi:MAG: urease accessory protein UreE [Acidimicrobiia bacterium]
MERVERVVGWLSDRDIGERVHVLAHRGRVEHVELGPMDAARHRLRVVSDCGTELAIALDRDDRLGDGAVLVLEDDRAIVLRLTARRWLRVRPATTAAALALGHRAGHLHWTVELDGDVLAVAVEGHDENDYVARIADLSDIEVVP